MEETISDHQGTLSENGQLKVKKVERNAESSQNLEMILKFLEEDLRSPKWLKLIKRNNYTRPSKYRPKYPDQRSLIKFHPFKWKHLVFKLSQINGKRRLLIQRGSVLKSTCYFCRGSWFDSQHLHVVLQPSITTLPQNKHYVLPSTGTRHQYTSDKLIMNKKVFKEEGRFQDSKRKGTQERDGHPNFPRLFSGKVTDQ